MRLAPRPPVAYSVNRDLSPQYGPKQGGSGSQRMEGARALAGLRSGDGPLSVRVRPSSLKRDCARRTTSTGGKMPGQRTREVTLDPGDLCGHSGQKPRGRGEPARTDAGHPRHGCTPSPGRLQREQAAVVQGLTRRVRTVPCGRGRRIGRRRTRRSKPSPAAGADASARASHVARPGRRRIAARVGGPGPADRPEPGNRSSRVSPGAAIANSRTLRNTT